MQEGILCKKMLLLSRQRYADFQVKFVAIMYLCLLNGEFCVKDQFSFMENVIFKD